MPFASCLRFDFGSNIVRGYVNEAFMAAFASVSATPLPSMPICDGIYVSISLGGVVALGFSW